MNFIKNAHFHSVAVALISMVISEADAKTSAPISFVVDVDNKVKAIEAEMAHFLSSSYLGHEFYYVFGGHPSEINTPNCKGGICSKYTNAKNKIYQLLDEKKSIDESIAYYASTLTQLDDSIVRFDKIKASISSFETKYSSDRSGIGRWYKLWINAYRDASATLPKLQYRVLNDDDKNEVDKFLADHDKYKRDGSNYPNWKTQHKNTTGLINESKIEAEKLKKNIEAIYPVDLDVITNSLKNLNRVVGQDRVNITSDADYALLYNMPCKARTYYRYPSMSMTTNFIEVYDGIRGNYAFVTIDGNKADSIKEVQGCFMMNCAEDGESRMERLCRLYDKYGNGQFRASSEMCTDWVQERLNLSKDRAIVVDLFSKIKEAVVAYYANNNVNTVKERGMAGLDKDQEKYFSPARINTYIQALQAQLSNVTCSLTDKPIVCQNRLLDAVVAVAKNNNAAYDTVSLVEKMKQLQSQGLYDNKIVFADAWFSAVFFTGLREFIIYDLFRESSTRDVIGDLCNRGSSFAIGTVSEKTVRFCALSSKISFVTKKLESERNKLFNYSSMQWYELIAEDANKMSLTNYVDPVFSNNMSGNQCRGFTLALPKSI